MACSNDERMCRISTAAMPEPSTKAGITVVASDCSGSSSRLT